MPTNNPSDTSLSHGGSNELSNKRFNLLCPYFSLFFACIHDCAGSNFSFSSKMEKSKFNLYLSVSFYSKNTKNIAFFEIMYLSPETSFCMVAISGSSTLQYLITNFSTFFLGIWDRDGIRLLNIYCSLTRICWNVKAWGFFPRSTRIHLEERKIKWRINFLWITLSKTAAGQGNTGDGRLITRRPIYLDLVNFAVGSKRRERLELNLS